MWFVAASRWYPESGGVSFRGGGEGMAGGKALAQMLSIQLNKCLLRARRLSLRADTVSVDWSNMSSCEICEVDQFT